MSSLTVTQKKISDLRGLLDKAKPEIAKALPRHLTPDRMCRIAITSIQKTPELLECDPISVVGAVMSASQLGLELDPVLGHAYLVPYRNKKAGRTDCQLIVGYKGYIALARRSGEVRSFYSHIAFANDVYTCHLGTAPEIIHRPNLNDRGAPVAVYSVLKLASGDVDVEQMGWPEILLCQEKYAKRGRDGKPYGPWIDHFHEMARKTPIRRIAKRAPVSVEMQRAAALDEMADAEIPQDLGAELGLTRTDEVTARLAQLAADSAEQPEAPAETPAAAGT